MFSVQIMYRPLRDLNGIPGAKSLIICLTGYQRQDRDDIMVCIAKISFLTIFMSCYRSHWGWIFHVICDLTVEYCFHSQTMVGLMGAQFSKPLVANKVTHLVCYKFEGAALILPLMNIIQNELGVLVLVYAFKVILLFGYPFAYV